MIYMVINVYNPARCSPIRSDQARSGPVIFDANKTEQARPDPTHIGAIRKVRKSAALNLDEVTKENDLRAALKEQSELGEVIESVEVRMRKGYGGSQTAELKVPADIATKLLAIGKIKVGWSV